MNPRLVIHQLGSVLLVLAAAMGVVTLLHASGALGGGRSEKMAWYALLFGVATTAASGGTLWTVTRRAEAGKFNRRDALLLVALVWMIGAAMAAVPYYAWAHLGGPPAHPGMPGVSELLEDLEVPQVSEHPGARHVFESFAACYFEAMSGLSTTGATVLGAVPYDIESLPRGLLLWRALTHWLGGLGIVVLFVAVLPAVGSGSKRLFQAEAAGSTATGVRPRIRESARVLWFIYTGLTAAQVVALRLAGMPWFHSVCHSLSDLATGGLSTRNASIGAYYDTPAVDLITIAFMLLAGVNFRLYYQLVNRNVRPMLEDTELRVYLGLLVAATVVIAAVIYGDTVTLTTGEVKTESAAGALRDSAFQVVAIQTGTGFCTVDFEQWPFVTKAILIALMFVGGMSGSTTGGLKVIRVMIAFKAVRAEFERAFRPNVVNPTRVGGGVVDADTVRSVPLYLLLVVAIFVVGSVTLMLLEPPGSLSYASAMSATISTLMNVGPGVAAVGAMDNYGFFSGPSLMVMSLLMALGRLEVFALLVLVMPRFWRET